MSSMPDQILRPIPRRMFELTPASTESSVPPSPAPETSNPELLEAKSDALYTPSKTRSILNLTSSTLLGIYSPTGYEANREDASTPWGTGTQTPSHRQSVDDSRAPLPSQGGDAPNPRADIVYRRGGFRNYYLPLFLRGVLLFVFGMAYGTIITHLHDEQELAPVKVEGFNRRSWSYVGLWGVSGIAMGSLLPWVDSAWETRFESKPPVQTPDRRRRASSLGPDNHGADRSSGRFNNGLGADWNPVVRSIGAFVGIAFAIRKLPWQSTLQVSLTLALANPVLWYLVDRSKTGFLLSTVVGIGGTIALLGINPDIVPSPPTPSPRAHLAGSNSVLDRAASRLPTDESIAIPRPSILLIFVLPLALALLINLGDFSTWAKHVKSRLEGSWPRSGTYDTNLTTRPLQNFDPVRQSVLQLISIVDYLTMGISSEKSHFRVLQTFRPEYSPCKITQYESQRTGMRVIVVDQEGPKLHGFFVLATEIHDDSGAPHTLEHLCFMGSKSYRYKGFLDKLATRAYSGTNAWTATDHTAYTLETAGWAGFAQILPVYLEHVIVPTLTDAGCTTEVHHIDGTGNDAGVVYSEMQGIQNTAGELMELQAKRIIYPDGVGFRYETGGMLEQLRVLTADRIREFHREMYQPKNLCVALFGEVEHKDLLKKLEDFESTILDDIPPPETPFKRPWMESKQIPPLKETVVRTVEFPEEDESFGQVEIRLLGPNCADPLLTGALNVALLYLAGSSAALLDNTLVEKEQLTSGVYYNVDSRPRSEIAFTLSSVETDKLEQVQTRFFEVLKDAMTKDLDMNFMQDCIDRQVRKAKYDVESSCTAFADPIIADFLYGKKDGSTLGDLGTLHEYEVVLSNWSQEEWRSFIKTYISDAHHVSILGKPSATLSEKLKADEAARVEQQKERLGPDGLKRMAEKLEQAKAQNDREIPKGMLEKFKVPSTKSIHFVTTSPARVGPALDVGRPRNKYQKIVDIDGKDIPLFMDFEHIPSNFVRINLILSTQGLPLDLLPLLSIYMEAFFSIPIRRKDTIIDFDEVVVELERDTVGYGIDSAGALGNTESLCITFQVELQKYRVAIAWIRELLWDSIFDVERLKTINSRLLSDVPDSKRSGDDMLTAVHLMVHLAPESIGRARCTLVKALYLKRIKRLLKTDADAVVAQFERLRKALCRFENFRVLVIADLEKLLQPVSSWAAFLRDLDTSNPLTPLGKRQERLSEAGRTPGKLAYIVPMPTIDSSFAFCTAQGPKTYGDPGLPALMVAMSYMNAVEGPLWTAVRGTGLAYGTSISYDIESGYVNLDVYRSPDAYRAFEASRKIVAEHIDGTVSFDPLMLEGAISSIVVAFANEQQTLASAAQASFVRQVMRGLPPDYMDTMLGKVREIEVDDIKAALKDVVFRLFTPGKVDIVMTVAPNLKDSIKEGLEKDGFHPDIQSLEFFQDDYRLQAGDSSDSESEDGFEAIDAEDIYGFEDGVESAEE